MKRKLFLLVLICSGLFLSAQNENNNLHLTDINQEYFNETGVIKCLSSEYNTNLVNQGRLTPPESLESFIAQKIANMANQSNSQEAVLAIPVVVHVVHNGEAIGVGANIADEQVLSQITVFNQDFRKMAGTPGDNSNPVGADTGIEFCLAQVTPEGNASSGINRINGGQTGWDHAGIEAYKTSTQWDPTKYFNIWVCNLTGGILGYAQFPDVNGLVQGLDVGGGASNTDGVVMLYTAFGSSTIYPEGTYVAPYDKGRTATHEVAHWLGLRHIWGDSNCGDDFCEDTPTQATSTYNCPTGVQTSCGSDDMYENYMDYTQDACMNVFTVDQKARMRVILNGDVPNRTSLLTSEVCDTTPRFNLSTTNDSKAICGGDDSISYVINYTTLFSYNDVTTFSVTNGLPTGATATFSPQALSNDGEIILTIDNLYSAGIGEYIITVTGSGTITKTIDLTLEKKSVSRPTPNAIVDYVSCDNTSGTDNDGVALFNLPLKSDLVLAGLNSSEYIIDFYTSLMDAEGDTNAIINPAAYISSDTIIYVKVQSTSSSCYDITQINLLVKQACHDIGVTLISHIAPPRPGFDYYNKLVVKNNGEFTVSSGTVEFAMDDLLTYNNATGVTTGNTLTTTATGFTLDFVNLAAGAQEEIYIDMNVPTSAILGDMLTSSAAYTTNANDIYEENDTATLSETIIGSYDPNDIFESHGPEILHESFTDQDYLYYTIRFQNVGTASAIFINIDNTLDARLDKTTFEMLHASHSYEVERDFDHLNWFFDNINLADSTSDEPNSHGYVHYKIKPLPGYSVGDIVPNLASIVFDFNAPIITNTFSTEFVAPLSINDEYKEVDFVMYPNPSKEKLFIQIGNNKNVKKIEILDMLGKIVLSKTNSSENNSVNISNLTSGVYFVKVEANDGKIGIKRLVKN